MTVFKRFKDMKQDDVDCWLLDDEIAEIRRALAVAQAVEELNPPLLCSSKMQEAYLLQFIDQIMRRADELLEGK